MVAAAQAPHVTICAGSPTSQRVRAGSPTCRRHLRRVTGVTGRSAAVSRVGGDERGRAGSGGESTFTVVLAFFANARRRRGEDRRRADHRVGVDGGRGAHSWADTGNEVLLLVADQALAATAPMRRTRSATAARRTSGRCSPRSGCSPPAPWSRSGHGVNELSSQRATASTSVAYVVLGDRLRARGDLVRAGLPPDPARGPGARPRPPRARARHLRPHAPGRVRRGRGRADRAGARRRSASSCTRSPATRRTTPSASILVGLLLGVVAVRADQPQPPLPPARRAARASAARYSSDLKVMPDDRPGLLPPARVRRSPPAAAGPEHRPGQLATRSRRSPHAPRPRAPDDQDPTVTAAVLALATPDEAALQRGATC